MGNKGLRDQIKESSGKDYKDFTLEKLIDYCIELSKPKNDYVIFTGKLGALEYYKALYKNIGLSEHVIRVRLARDNRDLKEGYYQIGTLGIKYYG